MFFTLKTSPCNDDRPKDLIIALFAFIDKMLLS